jgi:hypothetical protein
MHARKYASHMFDIEEGIGWFDAQQPSLLLLGGKFFTAVVPRPHLLVCMQFSL